MTKARDDRTGPFPACARHGAGRGQQDAPGHTASVPAR
jgi:hypothetical protein